jgi:hypothetical protein
MKATERLGRSLRDRAGLGSRTTLEIVIWAPEDLPTVVPQKSCGLDRLWDFYWIKSAYEPILVKSGRKLSYPSIYFLVLSLRL